MKKVLFLIIPFLIIGCNQSHSYQNVGDIPFDKLKDNISFKICDEANIKQYYVRKSSDKPSSYLGEKKGLENTILDKYFFPKTEKENGYLTLRFIVNCKGESGRFRVEEMDYKFKPFNFDKKITEQLLKIVKNLNKWIPRRGENKEFDFYQYLTFKIKNGQIIKILP